MFHQAVLCSFCLTIGLASAFLPRAKPNLDCGEVIRNSTGTIQSPLFPEAYPPSQKCKWRIIVPVGHTIRLEFKQFQLEETDLCEFDNVKVRVISPEGDWETMGPYCGTNIIPVFRSRGNIMMVYFNSDFRDENLGFSAEFTSENGAIGDRDENEIVDEKEFIDENEIVDEKENNEENDFSVKEEITIENTCSEDEFSCTETKHCIPDSWQRDNYDDCGDGSDVVEEYTSTEDMPEICSNLVSSTQGIIQSPNYPDNYPANLQCSWNFSANPGHKIKMVITNIDIERTAQCESDRLVVYDGPSKRSPLMKYMCIFNNTVSPEPLMSSNNTLFMAFKTDMNIQASGFKIKHSTVCGGTLQADKSEKMLYSYPGPRVTISKWSVECDWVIEAPEGHGVQLRFVTLGALNTSPQSAAISNCEYGVFGQSSFLKVYGGPDASSSLLWTFCGKESLTTVVTQSSKMFLQFRSSKEKILSFIAGYQASY